MNLVTQHVLQPTRTHGGTDSTLDLVFTNNADIISDILVVERIADCCCQLPPRKCPAKRKVFLWKKADEELKKNL